MKCFLNEAKQDFWEFPGIFVKAYLLSSQAILLFVLL